MTEPLEGVAGVREIVDTRPADRWEDAFLSGNGEYGIMVFGDPHRERMVHTHHRFVLPNGSRDVAPPELADRLEEVRDLILSGRCEQVQQMFSDGRDLIWPQPFHPGHVLHIDAVQPVGAPESGVPVVHDYRRTTRFTTGEVITAWTVGPHRHRRRAFVSRPDRVVVVEIIAPGAELEFRLSAENPGCPGDLAVSTAAERVGADTVDLTLVATYPSSAAGFFGHTRLRAVGGTVRVGGDRVRVRGARSILLLTRLERWHTRAPVTEMSTTLSALPDDYAILLARHARVHGELFSRCSLELSGSDHTQARPVEELLALARTGLDPVLAETLFASGRYLLLSSCGVLPPRLTGLWLGSWDAAWSDDFTTDANLNLQIAAVTVTGMPELLAGYIGLLSDQVEDWRLNARLIYGVEGFLAPSRTDGEHGRLIHLHADWPWPMWLAGADWLLLPLVEYWQVSGDDDFLAEVLAPWLLEVATFFEQFATRRDVLGQALLVPSYSPETGPLHGRGVAAVNATMDLAAARHALVLAADVLDRLGPGRCAAAAGSAGRWRDLAALLPDYPVDARGALAEWAWPGAVTPLEHRHVSHLYPVWPLHEITPQDTPGLAAAALIALKERGDENLSAHGSLHRALAAARLRSPELVQQNLRKILGENMIHRSLMTSHHPDLDIYNADAAHGLPAVMVEMLLDSRPGRLDLLPALPAQWRAGRVRGLRTRAGVVVTDLTWGPGQVDLTLEADVEQVVTVFCRAARSTDQVGRTVRVRPGTPAVVTCSI